MKGLIAFVILIIVIVLITYADSFFGTNCPKETMGNQSAAITVKYFSSPFCIACWRQKPILTELFAENGNKFYLEEYDVDFCRDAAAPHYVTGVPSFIIEDKLIYGLQSKEQLEHNICGGECA